MRRTLSSLFFLFSLIASPLFAQTADTDYDEKRNETDMDALRKWLRDKRMVSVKESGGDLAISGQMRTEFQYINERKNDIQQRGGSSSPSGGRPPQVFDVEFNLLFDYRTDRTWAAIKIEYDNDMGVRSGTMGRIKLERAYLGGRIVPGDTFTIDAEIGRRFLYDIFDSKVEFATLFDGIFVRFDKALPEIGNFYVHPGAFLIDDKTNHYGYVAEVGALRIANTGLNIKFAEIDWQKHFTNETKTRRYRFLVTQALASYQYTPDWFGKRLVKVYGAGLYNALAKGIPATAGHRAPWAWYAGVALGMVRKQGDWAIEANYQWVQAQAIPDFDVSGIGHGNSAGVGLYTANIDGEGAATTISTAVGSCNYKGFDVDVFYAFTDNLTIQSNYRMSHTLNVYRDSSGHTPKITFKQYEIEFIYAF